MTRSLIAPKGPISTLSGPEQTRIRLLDAAESLFAEHGYAKASVRDITQAARSNLASVNYHFGSKDELYKAVFERRLAELRQEREEAVHGVAEQAAKSKDVALVLRAFTKAFLTPLSDPKRGKMMLQLFMREMNDPHLPSGMFLDRMTGPMEKLMGEAIVRACPGIDRAEAALCFHSHVAQLVHIVQMWKMASESGRTDGPMADMDKAVDHVVRFTAAAITALAKEGGA
ncbi:MAG: DUF1956 domain-containing protein [Planctomycetes bacterium]|nr:DUF1956 domain-containing protein [Planctomycetota bacterium]